MRAVWQWSHSTGCVAGSQGWTSPWVVDANEPLIWRKTIDGRSLGRWLRLRCNDPMCVAVLFVRENDVMAALPAKFNGPKGGSK